MKIILCYIKGGHVDSQTNMKQKNMTVLLLVVISLICHIREALCLRIGAFNVRIFGTTKAADGNVMDALVKVSKTKIFV